MANKFDLKFEENVRETFHKLQSRRLCH